MTVGDVTASNGSGPTTIAGTSNVFLEGGNYNASITNAGHSELTASSGGIALSNSPNLVLSVGSGFATSNGTVYTIIGNSTGQPTTGTFANLPQGATVTAGGQSFVISYTGGSSGHDVTLTATTSTPTPTGPTIASTAAVYATAKSIKLSAVASDSTTALTNGLTYTWSTVKAPSGAKTITFSPNGTNASSTTVGAISKDGTYTFNLTVKDANGHTTTSVVQFYARQIARGLEVIPASAKVKRKGHLTFTATALDQFGHPLRTNTTTTAYSVVSGFGSVTAAGVYTASSTKTGKSVVKVTLDGESSDATITVS